jgi:hypothetical protein
VRSAKTFAVVVQETVHEHELCGKKRAYFYRFEHVDDFIPLLLVRRRVAKCNKTERTMTTTTTTMVGRLVLGRRPKSRSWTFTTTAGTVSGGDKNTPLHYIVRVGPARPFRVGTKNVLCRAKLPSTPTFKKQHQASGRDWRRCRGRRVFVYAKNNNDIIAAGVIHLLLIVFLYFFRRQHE